MHVLHAPDQEAMERKKRMPKRTARNKPIMPRPIGRATLIMALTSVLILVKASVKA